MLESIWRRLRIVAKLPGIYSLYKMLIDKAVSDGKIFKIQRGPLSGLKWVHFHGYQIQMALGTYESGFAEALSKSIEPGDIFFDVGAHAGYFSLLAASLVGEDGLVIAVDPFENNCVTIETQLKINDLSERCTKKRVAISDEAGQAVLTIPQSSAKAHLEGMDPRHKGNSSEKITVTTRTLDELVDEVGMPKFIKIDIEGAEVAALMGSQSMLVNEQPPVFYVSTHSDELKGRAREILSKAGFTVNEMDGFPQMLVAMPPDQVS